MKYIPNHFAILITSIIVLSQQLAFAGTDLSRSKAEELLQTAKGNANWLSQWCRLAPMLTRKPEFESIKNESWCRMKITVSGIRTTSPTEAIVQWVAVGEVNQSLVKQWISGMNKLQDRLKNLPAQKYCLLYAFKQRYLYVLGV